MTKILPIGFRDLIGKEALLHQEIINNLLKKFTNDDYIFIKPSLVEFADDGKSCFQAQDLYSGKNIIVRNDITLQIKRLLQTSFINAKFPLKICYSGDIINLKEDKLLYRNVKRQVTQVGLEIIDKDWQAITDIISEIFSSIMDFTTFDDLILEISPVNFFQKIADDLGFEVDKKMLQAIYDKNISFLMNQNIKQGEIISELLLTQDISKIRGLLKKMPISNKLLEIIASWAEINELILKRVGKNLQINFDIFSKDNSYHQNISFKILSKNHNVSFVKGGDYKIKQFNAVGATIYVDNFVN